MSRKPHKCSETFRTDCSKTWRPKTTSALTRQQFPKEMWISYFPHKRNMGAANVHIHIWNWTDRRESPSQVSTRSEIIFPLTHHDGPLQHGLKRLIDPTLWRSWSKASCNGHHAPCDYGMYIIASVTACLFINKREISCVNTFHPLWCLRCQILFWW